MTVNTVSDRVVFNDCAALVATEIPKDVVPSSSPPNEVVELVAMTKSSSL